MTELTEEQKQYQKMTATPIPRLVTRLAVPTIISMLVTAVYNMADTFFVARLGTSAAGAVGIVFSLMALIQAVGFTVGIGSGSLISRILGQKDYERANRTGSSGFFMAIFLGAFFTVLGLLTLTPLLKLLGATPTILPFARDYTKYILLGAPVMCASFVLNNILRSEGNAALAMVGISTGGLLNIALDPIFIFGFKLGISGAAIATVLSQCVSFLILLSCFLRKKSTVRIHVKHLSRNLSAYLEILRIGFPSFCRQGLASVATAALNVNAAAYGDPAVAGMSIVGRIFMIVIAVMIGFGQGFQPVAGFNYGAQKYDRVKKAVSFSLKTGVVLMSILAVAGFLSAPWLMAMFRKEDADVIAVGTYAIRAQCLALPLFPLGVLSNMTFQVLGKSWQATLLSSARQGIFFLPLILILPQVIGLKGVQLTQPLADVLTFFLCIPFMVPFFRELNAKIEEQTKLL